MARRPLDPQRPSSLRPSSSSFWSLKVTALCLPLALTSVGGCKGAGGPAAPSTRSDQPVGASPEPGQHAPNGTPSSPGSGEAVPESEEEHGLISVLAPDSHAVSKTMSPDEARSQGFTVLDLRDDWTPHIFATWKSPEGQELDNRYRRVFVGLANDELDRDGEPLEPGEKNYLELYGLFPSLRVMRERFLADAEKTCLDPADITALQAVETVAYVPPAEQHRDELRLARFRKELELARKKFKQPTLEALVAAQPSFEGRFKALEKRALEKPAMAAVEKRLACEGLLGPASKHKTGSYDDAMRLAVRRFQQKHMIYEANYLRKKTMDALERPLLDNDYAGLVRLLRERIVDAAGVIEDGTTDGREGPRTFVDHGHKVPMRNLAEELTQATLEQLGLQNAPAALAFFKAHPAEDFKTLRTVVKLAALPPYYSPTMDLSITVDRGDVWYDPPFDANDKWHQQPRKHYPSLTLSVRWEGQNIALARWRTTVGGWRAEQASDGYEYYKYKGSDIGPRVIRNVISGPVWIAPASTPIRTLVKSKLVNGGWMPVVNYDELGPGYLSAYGLVAGYFVVPGKDGKPDFDNGIRAHGSSDYLSIYSSQGFSHGCHRLPNHVAIRLYDFLLRHRTVKVHGDTPMGFSRQFLFKDKVFEMRIPSKGFVFELDPPLPVNVLEGQIMGDAKKPILGYVPKPGVRYPGPPPSAPNGPGDRAGGAAPAAAASGED